MDSSTTIQIQLDSVDEKGKPTTEVVDVNIDTSRLTMRESVALEEALGTEAFDKIMSSGTVPMRPSTIQAIIYAKLKARFPNVGLNDFDFDLSALAEEAVAEQSPNV